MRQGRRGNPGQPGLHFTAEHAKDRLTGEASNREAKDLEYSYLSWLRSSRSNITSLALPVVRHAQAERKLMILRESRVVAVEQI